MKAFLLLIVVLSCLGFSAKKIEVNGTLKSDLNNVLKGASDLHGACFNQDEALIAAQLKKLVGYIDQARKRVSLEEIEKTHLEKMLHAAKGNLENSLTASGEDRENSLKGAFEQLVNLAKAYQLERYQIFFCYKDKSTWLQKGWRPQNPIHPKKYGKCGALVR